MSVEADLRSARLRFAGSCALGGGVAAVVFGMLLLGTRGVLHPELLGGLYEAQARSWLHGRWDVPSAAASFERFRIGGKYYMYFGPWPAVLRVPVVAFTERFDARLGRVSMFAAYLTFLMATARISWQVRGICRGRAARLGWRGVVASAGFVLIVGMGSNVLFLASRTWVYHEALLWGVAWASVSFSCLIAYILRPRSVSLVLASLTATLALLSRPSVGSGPVIALGLLVVAVLADAVGRRTRSAPRPSDRLGWVGRLLGLPRTFLDRASVLPSFGALLVPVMAYVSVNHVKFGSWFAPPYAQQDLLTRDPDRAAALVATSNRLTGVRYVIPNMVAYLRPDGIDVRSTFPWITFSHRNWTNGLRFDPQEAMASIPTSTPLLFLLAVVGIIVVGAAAVRSVRPATDRPLAAPDPSLEILCIPVVGAMLGVLVTLSVASRAFRYETDFVPVAVIAGSVTVWWVGLRLARAPRISRAVIAAAVVLGIWSCWTMVGVTLIYQREYSAFQDPEIRASFFRFQLGVNDTLGIGLPEVRRGATLPGAPVVGIENATADPHGRLFVVGRCEGLYISTGRAWEPIERRSPGQARWAVTFGRPKPGSRSPLWSSGEVPDDVVWAHWLDPTHVRLEYASQGETVVVSEPFLVEAGREYRFDIQPATADGGPEFRPSVTDSGGDTDRIPFLSVVGAAGPEGNLGRQPNRALGPTRFDGTVRRESLTPSCDRLTR